MAYPTIPANETWLAADNWYNGTLDGSPRNEWTPAGNSSQQVNLTILPDNIGSIQFNATNHMAFFMIFPLVRTVLSSDYYSGTVSCNYPISGTYDFLTRILFYVLMLCALLFRRHSWLAIAALGTAMAYSATVAVHALALLSQFGWHTGRSSMESSQRYGDPDIMGAYPILLASLVMMTPILNWSTSIRRDKSQIIVVLWGLLIFVAWAPVQVYVSSSPKGKQFHPWNYNFIPALVICPLSAVKESPICVPGLKLTLETYTTCQCFDFCGLIGPPSPMRAGAKMVPWLKSEDAIKRWNNKAYNDLDYFSQVMAVVVVLYGVFGLLHNQFSLVDIRNLIFRSLDTHPRQTAALWRFVLRKVVQPSKNKNKSVDAVTETNRTGWRKLQYYSAKTVATFYFLLGMAITFVCPLTFIAVVVVNEYDVAGLTYGESNDAVGAWSTWVGAAFVLIVAVVLQYQDDWEFFFLSIGDWALRVGGVHAFEEKMQEKKEGKFKNNTKRGFMAYYIKAVTKEIWAPFVHTGHSIHRALNTVFLACAEFGAWVSAPVPHTQICGCEGCASYTAKTRAANIPSSHADKCKCNHCVPIQEKAKEVFARHEKLPGECGCHFCNLGRPKLAPAHNGCPCKNCKLDRKQEEDKRAKAGDQVADETEPDYKTLGMRIVQMFDDRISDMLQASGTLPRYSTFPIGEKLQPVVSVSSTDGTNTALSINNGTPVKIEAAMNLKPDETTATSTKEPPIEGQI
ncbi:hypothetical protein P154DRAFT_572285 [Amniculicola lignicola CBS 123094]|uniref:Uncharacterized protein n=1 Tax=Amniculicola lignicola CBS 123094 TaxID=1392246 RepID=A0A6A5WVT1_9PLEO|nr:hypothetical protein P154DRAFT_572285 [Amniculicola lignicola CBS 123094]